MATVEDMIDLFSLVEDTREDDLAMAFAVCDAMTHLEMHIPEQWEYRHAPGCEGADGPNGYEFPWPDSQLWDMVKYASADTMNALRTFGWYVQGRLETRPEVAS